MSRVVRKSSRSVMEIVENTRGIKWWIDAQIAKGRTNEEIEAALPVATAFIIGELTLGEIQAMFPSRQAVCDG